jgi:hypothetical protein
LWIPLFSLLGAADVSNTGIFQASDRDKLCLRSIQKALQSLMLRIAFRPITPPIPVTARLPPFHDGIPPGYARPEGRQEDRFRIDEDHPSERGGEPLQLAMDNGAKRALIPWKTSEAFWR